MHCSLHLLPHGKIINTLLFLQDSKNFCYPLVKPPAVSNRNPQKINSAEYFNENKLQVPFLFGYILLMLSPTAEFRWLISCICALVCPLIALFTFLFYPFGNNDICLIISIPIFFFILSSGSYRAKLK